MAEIPLVNKNIAIVDDCDAHLKNLTKYKWYLLKGKNIYLTIIKKYVKEMAMLIKCSRNQMDKEADFSFII